MKPRFLRTALVAALATAGLAAAHAARPAHSAPPAPKAAASAAAPTLPGPPFPRFDTAAQVDAACQAGLDGARTRVRTLETRKSGLDWLKAWEALYDWQEDTSGALLFLENVHPDAAIRTAAEACELKWQDFQSTLGLDEKAYRIGKESKFADPVDRRTAQVALEGFEDAGVGLPEDKRAHAKEISDRITALGQQFQKNIRDAHVRVLFTEAELKDVPESVWKDRPREPDGRIALGVDQPSYYPVMQAAENPSARERMYRAKLNEGGADNLKLLQEIEQLRLEYAQLFGYPTYADFLLRHRMAESLARATKFLDDVHAGVTEEEKRDVLELRQVKARHLKQPLDAVKIERWDVMFYTELGKREKFGVDDEAFRPYFPPQESLRFVMHVAEKMFNVRYERVPGSFWAPDVQAYAVIDNATRKPLASLYVDLYPREGKYNHAAVWSYRNAATSENRQAEAALVVNFDRKGLTLRELEILLHEFGHSLHSNLSATRYASVGGTNVMQDFVEAPSQMLQDWVYDKKVLKLFQEVCPTCKLVPDEMVDKAKAAKDYDKGIYFGRQWLYAAYDLSLHGTSAPDPLDTWSRMEGQTPLGTVPGTMFPSGFAHLVSGYGAGYYGYLWSLVVAMDLRTAFAADKLDPKVGARYRATVIGQGGQKVPQQLVHDFLGRDLSNQAFFDYLRK